MGALPTRLLAFLRGSETIGPVALALAVGLLGATGVIALDALMELSQELFFEGRAEAWVPFSLHVLLLPPLGLLLVTLLVAPYAPEAVGTGVPQVMYAVRKRGGRISKRTAPMKALASALTIGTGGAVGREGPVVQIGSGLGSMLAQLLGLREARVQLLVACGAAAAIGANFDAPIAGAIFALEVILGSFRGRDFGLVVLASVSGTVLARAVLGDEPAFRLPEVFVLESVWELPLYLALGLLAGFTALALQRIIYGIGDRMGRIASPPWTKAVGAGLAVGALGWGVAALSGEPWILGVGYTGIETALAVRPEPGGALAWDLLGLMVVLAVLKPVATALTLGGGGSGGIFAPSLFVGAMLGGAFGLGVGEVLAGWPGDGMAPPGAYALVGMAAVFGAAAHAPITASLILFEMSDNYRIILPLMLAVGLAYLVASRLSPESLYSVRLRRLGGYAPLPPEPGVLDLVLVADAMVPNPVTVRPDTSVTELAAVLHGREIHSVPVLDEEGALVGIVTASDLWNVLTGEAESEGRTVRDIMSQDLATVTPERRLREVLERLETDEVSQLLVVDRENPRLLLGLLRRQELFWAFGEMMSEHRRLVQRTGVDLPTDALQLTLPVSADQPRLAFRPIRALGLPSGALVLVLRRGGRALVPRGDTVVEPGDVLVLVTTREAEARLRRWIRELDRGP